MSKLKGDLVNGAYQKLRISGLTSKATPEEISIALGVMEDMIREFSSRNICSSYVQEEYPDSGTDSRLELEYNSAVEWNLAMRLAPYFGKEPSIAIVRQANQSLSNWSARSAQVRNIQAPRRMPRGSGNTFRWVNWFRYNIPSETNPISCDTLELKLNEVNNFSVSFAQYLNDLETIMSYTIDVSEQVELVSSSQEGPVINFTLKGLKVGAGNLTVTITTSDSRINPERININVKEV